MSKTAAVIIFFNPTKEDVSYVASRAGQWEGVVVDNSEKPCVASKKLGKMTYVCNGKNIGIAEAQNIGIRHLLKDKDITHVVFFDQDSRVPAEYLEDISQEFVAISQRDTTLALLGPTVIRKDNGEEYKSAVHHYTSDCEGFSRRSHIISSGSCASAEALCAVGLMESTLFIDYVDFEWCWRAALKGYAMGVTDKITIEHKVGQRELSIGNHKVIISSPFRYFYQYRNFLWLLRRKYVPLRWKLATGVKFLARSFYYPFVLKDAWNVERNMARGMLAGLKSPKQQRQTKHGNK